MRLRHPAHLQSMLLVLSLPVFCLAPLHVVHLQHRRKGPYCPTCSSAVTALIQCLRNHAPSCSVLASRIAKWRAISHCFPGPAPPPCDGL
jgi:hypothetical protein